MTIGLYIMTIDIFFNGAVTDRVLARGTIDMDAISQGQLTSSAADVYEQFFVPALFQEWAWRVADAADIRPGHMVLDVACGTGVLAREVASRVEPAGSVVGLDRNAGMLSVARRQAANLQWREGMAESLPFEDEAFDAVVSQFGLMFFEDRIAALREMWRVLRPCGRLTVAVWDALEKTPGYSDMTSLLARLFGEDIADELRTPYSLGDVEVLGTLCAQAGIAPVTVRSLDGQARFPSIWSWVETDVKGWTLADLIDEAQFQTLAREAAAQLAQHEQSDGSVAFRHPALIVTAVKS